MSADVGTPRPEAELWPSEVRVVRWRAASVRLHSRVWIITGLLALLCVVAAIWSMTIGDTDLSLRQQSGDDPHP